MSLWLYRPPKYNDFELSEGFLDYHITLRYTRWVLISAVLLFSFSSAATSQATRPFVIFLTAVFLVGVAVGALFLLVRLKHRKRIIIVVTYLCGMILYAVIARFWSSGSFPDFFGPNSAFGDSPVIFNIFITAVLSICFIQVQKKVFTVNSLWFILFSFFTFFITTYLLDGIVFSPWPKINFEFSDLGDGPALYSQGFSRLAGLAALAAAVLFATSGSLFSRVVAVLAFAIAIGLCLIGGGRGEFIALVVAVLFACRRNLLYVLMWVAFSIVAVIYFGDFLSEVQLVARLAVFVVGDFGMRDTLAVDSLTLLADHPNCMVVGCGFGFFQYALNYPAGLYPHNLFFEAVLVFGLPVVVVSAFFGFRQLRRFLSVNDEFMVGMLIFLSVLAMKGGTMFSDPFLMAFILGATVGGVQALWTRSHPLVPSEPARKKGDP